MDNVSGLCDLDGMQKKHQHNIPCIYTFLLGASQKLRRTKFATLNRIFFLKFAKRKYPLNIFATPNFVDYLKNIDQIVYF